MLPTGKRGERELSPQVQAYMDSYGGEEDYTPVGFKILFPEVEDGADLTTITETPGRMVLPLVRMRLVDAAYNPRRRVSLNEMFVSLFDRRMIGYNRKGRIEGVRILQGAMRALEGEEEEGFM